MAGKDQPFRYFTNEEFFALTHGEQLQYLAAAVLEIGKEDRGIRTSLDRFAEPGRPG